MGVMTVPGIRVVLFDWTRQGVEPSLLQRLQRGCQVTICARLHSAVDIGCTPVDMLMLLFDEPDSAGLLQLRALKEQHPSIPLTMLTRSHSEALAVWAFRAGVWDYLVCPLAEDEWQSYFSALQRLCRLRGRGKSAPSKRVLGNGRIARNAALPEEVRCSRRAQASSQIQQIVHVIERDYAQALTAAALAARFGISAYRFSRCFKQQMGMSFNQYLTQRRLSEAQRLLRHSQMAVSALAYCCGYRDPAYFSRVFQRAFACSPSEYREQLGGGRIAVELRAEANPARAAVRFL